MANSHSMLDRIFYANRREYTHKEGSVAYLDGSPLSRPLKMPATQRIIAMVIVLIAAALGAVFVNNTILTSIRETTEAEQIIESNLQRPASIETVPLMDQLINADNNMIFGAFNGAGYPIYDASDPDDPTNLVLYKIPSDVGMEEAAVMYARGISNLSAIQATRLLNGSWYFAADRDSFNSIIVRYADFTTGDPLEAAKNALEHEGFGDDSVTERGEDDSGNTYLVGTVDADGTPCAWKISALPLEDMYSIRGMPEEACYVGIRVTAQ